MGLVGNGQLLVKLAGVTPAAVRDAKTGFRLPGYDTEPLAPHVHQLRLSKGPQTPSDHWLVARPLGRSKDATTHSPWDEAHEAAAKDGYDHYIEPDLLHPGEEAEVAKEEEKRKDEFYNKNWPPTPLDPAVGVSPGWHLGPDYSGFALVRDRATGTGVRIAHLDTGYFPHFATPRNLKPNLGYDYWGRKKDPLDPLTTVFRLLQPGHGTATLALLAGSHVDLKFGQAQYVGDIGGAPDAEVIPIRIGPTVVHFCSSSMAKGLFHALAPCGDPDDPIPGERPCDVVTCSHGGLPSAAWASAVNHLYEAGIIVVAASGDSFHFGPVDLATRFTVYPSAFNCVLTAVGATYDLKGYATDIFSEMQGCWGPDPVMNKAIAGFTPNVPWLNCLELNGFSMHGGGTSAATPQVAAACALWVQLYGSKMERDWKRVAACRMALFHGAHNVHPDRSKLGNGTLHVPGALDDVFNTKLLAHPEVLEASQPDSVSVPFWRLMFGAPPPGAERDSMYEVELAQLLQASKNPELRKLAVVLPDAKDKQRYLDLVAAEGASDALKQRLAA